VAVVVVQAQERVASVWVPVAQVLVRVAVV
jgi:hypothetical protein